MTENSDRERFELAVQGTDDGLWYWDLKSEVFEYSVTWAQMLGYELGELETNVDEWFSRVHPGYLAEVSNQLSAICMASPPNFEMSIACCERRILHLGIGAAELRYETKWARRLPWPALMLTSRR